MTIDVQDVNATPVEQPPSETVPSGETVPPVDTSHVPFQPDNQVPQEQAAAGNTDQSALTATTAQTTPGPNFIADGAITEDKLADGAVTEPKIADHAVTATKIAGVSKLIFATCSFRPAADHPGTFDCSVPGAAAGDTAIVTQNIVSTPTNGGYGLSNQGWYVMNYAKTGTDKVTISLGDYTIHHLYGHSSSPLDGC